MDGYTVILMTVSMAMLFFAPLVAAFIGTELLAKEAGDGTLKLSLMRPVSRVQVLVGQGWRGRWACLPPTPRPLSWRRR